MKILVINGPNLNMIEKRGGVYGNVTMDDIGMAVTKLAARLGATAEFFQSNCEGEIIDEIQLCDYDGLIINGGAFSHYSYAIADALDIPQCPKIEVHMSNIYAREEFRRTSVLSAKCDGVICGFLARSYILATEQLIEMIKSKSESDQNY